MSSRQSLRVRLAALFGASLVASLAIGMTPVFAQQGGGGAFRPPEPAPVEEAAAEPVETTLEAPQPAPAEGRAAEADRREPLWSSPQHSEPSMSSDMWLYLHEQRRHDDPKQAVRRKAELKAAQRAERLAAQRWYGVSNQRPTASTSPFMGGYSASWSGFGTQPAPWSGVERRPLPVVIDMNARR